LGRVTSGLSIEEKYQVYDIYGSLVLFGKAFSSIDVSILNNGIYNIRIIDNSGRIVKTEKIVIAH
jgi:hypothetical protein